MVSENTSRWPPTMASDWTQNSGFKILVATEGFLGPLKFIKGHLRSCNFTWWWHPEKHLLHQSSAISHNRGKGVSERGRALSMGSRYLGHLLEIPAERTARVSPEKALAWVWLRAGQEFTLWIRVVGRRRSMPTKIKEPGMENTLKTFPVGRLPPHR